ncbi:MAG: efflux system, outer rane lipoprotein CmeC [Planctomycetaceae bacterium]|nr:efflux system, outer rane lipoprotein CmeC [Planctomycetaceae bacterium]
MRTCLWCALLLAGGCTPWREYISNGFKVGPNYQSPGAPVATQWVDGHDKRLQPANEDAPRWWTVFNDSVLNSLIETAFHQNLSLREAGFRILQARAQYGFARGNLFPQSQAMTGDYLREALSHNAANRSFVGKRFFDQWDYGFTAAWELDFWGRFRRAIESANENLNASVSNYDAVLVTLLGDVATNYVQIRTLEQQIKFTQANVDLQRQTLVLAEARFKAGATSDLDVEQARTVLAQTEAQIPVLEISQRQASNQLCILMGMPPEDLSAWLGKGDIPTAPADVAAGVPADLLRRRPDVQQAEHAAAAQSAQIGISQAEFYPHISLVGTLDYSTESLHKLITPGSLQGQVGPSYQWNILQYGRILNNVKTQDALFQQLVLRYQSTVLNAAGEVENGLVTFLKSQQQTDLQKEAVSAARKAVDLAVVQYREGRVDFNRVATLQLTLVQQQNLLAQARGQIATGLINVYRALGGGWQIRLESYEYLNVDGPSALPVDVPPPDMVPPLEAKAP